VTLSRYLERRGSIEWMVRELQRDAGSRAG